MVSSIRTILLLYRLQILVCLTVHIVLKLKRSGNVRRTVSLQIVNIDLYGIVDSRVQELLLRTLPSETELILVTHKRITLTG